MRKRRKNQKKKKRNVLDTSFLVLITDLNQIVTLKKGEKMSSLLKLKAKELYNVMANMRFRKDEIILSEKKYKPIKDLHQLIKNRIYEKH
jgi:hypothetical protein